MSWGMDSSRRTHLRTIGLYRECSEPLVDEDERALLSPMGQELLCGFAGDVDGTLDPADDQVEWVCPGCGAEHREGGADPYERDRTNDYYDNF